MTDARPHSNPPAMSSRPEQIGPPPLRQSSPSLILWIGLAGGALVLLLWLAMRNLDEGRFPSGARDPLVGESLNRLELAPLTGDPAPLDLQKLNGKVTLVNFWGTWCPPCQQEFPHLDALRAELASEPDFQFASVSCWQGIESDIDQLREETVSFLKQQRSDLPTYYDPQAVTRIAIMDAMRQNGFGYPMTILLDRHGVIRGAWRGYAPKMEVDMEQVTRYVLAK